MEGIHWTELLQNFGIIASLLLAAYTTHKDERARKISNSIAFNDQYREIWKEVYQHPEFARVLERNVDLEKQPISFGEERFVMNLILHVSTAFRAMKYGEFVTLEGMQMDVEHFFPLPIPKIVWQKMKRFQDDNFVEFVEKCLNF